MVVDVEKALGEPPFAVNGGGKKVKPSASGEGTEAKTEADDTTGEHQTKFPLFVLISKQKLVPPNLSLLQGTRR